MSGFFPQDEPQSEDLLNCMRCGACLPTCPTFQLTGRERSSPRGRIALMRAVKEGDIPLAAPIFAEEMDDCVGCLACTTSCPAGVDYAHLLEQSRDQVARLRWQNWPRWKKVLVQAVFSLFENLSRLRGVARLLRFYQISGLRNLVRKLGILRFFPKPMEELEKLLPAIPRRFSSQQIVEVTRGQGPRSGLLTGCVSDFLFAEENVATAEVLTRLGHTVVTPRQQGCCGALHAHAGHLEKARQLARHNIAVFEQAEVEQVVVNSAGCGNAMKHYAEWLHDDPQWAQRAAAFSQRVRDLLEVVPPERIAPMSGPRLTYHDACHLAHGQGIREQPRNLMKRISPSGFQELPQADRCCGSAGTYNLLKFDTALELLEDKIDQILSTGAEVVAVANPGCLLQIRYGLARRGVAVKAVHPVILLRDRLRADCKCGSCAAAPEKT